MSSFTLSPAPRFTRFDIAVVATLIGAVLLTALLIWRGDRVGVRVEQILPADGSRNASTQAVLRVTFAQPMVNNRPAEVTLDPPVTGVTRWEGQTLVFAPDEPFRAETEYTVEIGAGLRSEQGRILLAPIRWTFATSRPRIVFITYADDKSTQLAIVTPGETAEQLTQETFDVLDYALSPDGLFIVYTLTRADGGSDLWLIGTDGQNRRQLLDCGGSACSNAVWHPDSRRLVYERRNVLTLGAPPGPPRLWWLDVTSSATVAVFEDSQWLGLLASFSPDGQWLSYVAVGARSAGV
ncbi:MAG: Ig-like domain-containing protein [Chloroflexi bacterium]|nr:Ig-like domain-containing protein [Chloroflexota bacterium]